MIACYKENYRICVILLKNVRENENIACIHLDFSCSFDARFESPNTLDIELVGYPITEFLWEIWALIAIRSHAWCIMMKMIQTE